jgi:hypothetical protein
MCVRKGFALLSALLALLLAAGCTTKAAYEGLREGARQQCRQTPDAGAAQDCTDKVNRQTYEGYKAERDKQASPVFTK